jgi:hypothetical protein
VKAADNVEIKGSVYDCTEKRRKLKGENHADNKRNQRVQGEHFF